jgi:hypothetical protein
MSKRDFIFKMSLLSHFVKYYKKGKESKDKELCEQMRIQIERIVEETAPIVKKRTKAMSLVPKNLRKLFIV